MSSTLWAPYGDAIKLILTGSTNVSLSPEQKAVFTEMLSHGMRGKSGRKLKRRALPDSVRTKKYYIDEKKRKYEMYYYIPDVVLYMCDTLPGWSVMNPPVDLDYLNSLRDNSGKPLFLYSDAPGHKDWEESEEGQRHFDLVCRRIEVLREMDELSLTHHGNDPLKLDAQKRMRTELEKELVTVNRKLDAFESRGQRKTVNSAQDKKAKKETHSEYIAYPKAIMILYTSHDAKPEELAAWVWLGPENGGLSAFTNANELEPPPRFYYDLSQDDDYLKPLASCWFKESDIRNFQPSDRVISGSELINRWTERLGVVTEAFIQAKVSESRLTDIHPIYGGTRLSSAGDDSFPPLEDGLFFMTEIEAIEKEDFDTGKVETIPAETGSPEWRQENARKAANARHGQRGGNREKRQKVIDLWKSGDFQSKNACAKSASDTLGMAYSTARNALKNI